jgi:hypothetical protein
MASARSSGGPGVKRSKRRPAKPRGSTATNGLSVSKAKIARTQFDDVLGQGGDLWNDEEFEQFLAWLRESRRRRE